MAEKSLTLNEAMEQLRIINSDTKLKRLLFYADLQRLDENTRKRYEKELEDNIYKLEENIDKLEDNLDKLENEKHELEDNIDKLENKIETIIKTLYQNNSIEEISKMTNLEINYIKDILKIKD